VIIWGLSLPQTDQPGCEDLRHLVQALVGGHEIRRQRIAACKAVIKAEGSFAGALIHRVAVDLFAK
jgi:hypothetical protein